MNDQVLQEALKLFQQPEPAPAMTDYEREQQAIRSNYERLDVDLASPGLYEGGEPEADGARSREAHFGNRNWLTL